MDPNELSKLQSAVVHEHRAGRLGLARAFLIVAGADLLRAVKPFAILVGCVAGAFFGLWIADLITG